MFMHVADTPAHHIYVQEDQQFSLKKFAITQVAQDHYTCTCMGTLVSCTDTLCYMFILISDIQLYTGSMLQSLYTHVQCTYTHIQVHVQHPSVSVQYMTVQVWMAILCLAVLAIILCVTVSVHAVIGVLHSSATHTESD